MKIIAVTRLVLCRSPHFAYGGAFLIAMLLISIAASAQNNLTRIYGAADQTVPVPALIGTLGQQDASALQELIDYVKAVNIGKWQGMQASGTLTDASGNANQATLAIIDGDKFRLDVQTPKGERTTRISGSHGNTLEADGKSFFMHPATAKAGLLAFPRLLVSTFPATTTAFIDRGQIQIDGKALHRITLEEPAFGGASATDVNMINVTDLYFDPSSHLLIKSASAVRLRSAGPEQYLIVVSYGDYQNVQRSLVPLRYSQSLNGQSQWTLQIKNPDLRPTIDPSYFEF